jgi:hypothetical protein
MGVAVEDGDRFMNVAEGELVGVSGLARVGEDVGKGLITGAIAYSPTGGGC